MITENFERFGGPTPEINNKWIFDKRIKMRGIASFVSILGEWVHNIVETFEHKQAICKLDAAFASSCPWTGSCDVFQE